MEEQNRLGAILRAARENKGVTLAKVEAATRIRQQYLAALEEGRIEDLPEPVFVKGFLRNYAIFLGLNPQEVLDLYKAQYGPKGKDVVTIQPEIEPLRTPSRLTPAMLTVAVAFAVFLLVMYYLYQQYAAPPPPPTPAIVLDIPTPTPTVELTPEATRVPTPIQQDVVVPDVAGLTLQEADDALRKVGLQLEVVERTFSATAPAGIVLSQTVRAQTKVRPGSVIGVALSRGSQMVTVPRLIGLAYNDALARLNALNLKVQRVEVTGQAAPNTVVAQDPVENAQVAPNSIVKLTVSVGDVVKVPNVVGMELVAGKDALLKAGLVIGQVSFQGKEKLPVSELQKVCIGCILSTDPPQDSIVPRGKVINIGVRRE